VVLQKICISIGNLTRKEERTGVDVEDGRGDIVWFWCCCCVTSTGITSSIVCDISQWARGCSEDEHGGDTSCPRQSMYQIVTLIELVTFRFVTAIDHTAPTRRDDHLIIIIINSFHCHSLPPDPTTHHVRHRDERRSARGGGRAAQE
jgi:hypothetical protein